MPWYALTTKPRYERTTVQHLRNKGFDELAPAYRTRRRWSDRFKEIEQQLFPDYLFCSFTYEQRPRVLSTPGVISIVGFGKQPAPVADSEITAIRTMLASGLPLWPWPYLRVGLRVRIEEGCLKGLAGTLIRENDSLRVVVNVELLHRAVAIQIDRNLLRPLAYVEPALAYS